MTSWSSWARISKDLIKEILWPVLLFLEIGLFWYFKSFGPGSINDIFAGILFLGSLYFYIRRREESLEFIVFLIVFLGYAAMYNLILAFSVPLWFAEISVFIYTFSIFLYFVTESKLYSQNSLIYAIALSICVLEVFYILFFWPINPASKSFILTSLFYAFWFIVVKRDKVLNYLILVVVVLTLVLLTARWPVI